MADGATANGCGNASVIKEAVANGVNSTAVSAPVVFNYPVQPPDDTGRMMALASIIGGLFDALLGGDGLADAEAAQNTWKGLLDNTMKPRGESELARVDSERAKLPTFEADLSGQLTDYRGKADTYFGKLSPFETDLSTQLPDYRRKGAVEYADLAGHDTDLDSERDANRGEATTQYGKLPVYEADLLEHLNQYRERADIVWGRLDPLNDKINAEIDEYRDKATDEFDYSNVTCLDDAIDKLCEFVGCGYTPDYQGIATRARADAEVRSLAAYQEACRTGNRYNTRRSQTALLNIRLATSSAALIATAKGREDERQNAVKTNHEWRFSHAKFLEDARMGRRRLSMDYDKLALDNLRERWKAFAEQNLAFDGRADDISRERWRSYVDLHLRKDETANSISTERWKSLWNSYQTHMTQGDKLAELGWQRAAKLYLDMDGRADDISRERWKAYMESAFKSFQLGGEMLAAAMQAYQAFAASVRATSKQSGGGGGVAGLMAQLTVVAGIFSGKCGEGPLGVLGRPQNCCSST